MLPADVKDLVRSQIENVIDLRLLRGETPWSLAGTDGNRRSANAMRRDLLVARISEALRPYDWTAEIATVRSEAGRVNKLELVLHWPSGKSEVWSW